jgi:hypothetical protein
MATNPIVGSWGICAEKGSMANQRPFGRRGGPERHPLRAMGTGEATAPSTRVEPTPRSVERPVPLSAKADFSAPDDDLREWKLARKQSFAIPWRQLSLMATLCFGIGSLALPDSVNDNVQWVLYALAAASFYAGIRNRSRQAKT